MKISACTLAMSLLVCGCLPKAERDFGKAGSQVWSGEFAGTAQRVRIEHVNPGGQASDMETTERMLFRMVISPRDSTPIHGFGNDLLYGVTNGMGSYREAFDFYALGLAGRIWIEGGGNTYPVRLVSMENSWGLNPGRTFLFVFDDGLAEKAARAAAAGIPWLLVFEDIVPGTGRKKLALNGPLGEIDET